VDFITSLDGYGAAEGWPGWWGLEGPEYLAWLDRQPERDHTILMGANTYRLMSGFATESKASASDEPMTDEGAAIAELASSVKDLKGRLGRKHGAFRTSRPLPVFSTRRRREQGKTRTPQVRRSGSTLGSGGALRWPPETSSRSAPSFVRIAVLRTPPRVTPEPARMHDACRLGHLR
jgi:hypothetical protein